MSAYLPAREHNEAFAAVEEPTSEYVSRRIASDEEADTAFSYAISKHKKALEELARYDRA
ncbi:MAG: hypothetical protein LBB74_02330 [Chitinispirillales bacterium]|jgi:hypothetical protein|nr:hypothetical protein [Chitinispirillales bacterium]